jgi:tetratricopeptide (TPR) repeat protein
MGRIEKTVFISYRRTHFPWAYCIYLDLTHHGFDVFFDYQGIDSGNFESVILDNIRARSHFIVILAPSALERCSEPSDWLRREIETAMDERRNIIPIMLESFEFGSPLVSNSLTGKLSSLSGYNGMSLIAEYMDAGLEKLRNRYLNVALQAIHLHTLTEDAKEITETQKTAANEAPRVEKEELTAQEWFERGYIFGLDDDMDESIQCFTEAIRLNPSYEAYFNRGIIRRENGDLDGAIQDYNLAIRINPTQSQIYNNRGNARRDQGDLQGAMSDYDEAISLNPNAARVLINRGIVHRIYGNLDNALADFAKAISLRPTALDFAEAFYYRGVVFQLKGELEDAVTDYQRAISTASYHIMAGTALMSVLRKLGSYAEADEQETTARNLIARDNEYNRACFESICGNVDKALELLKLGLEEKQATKAWARLDPDLENIRNDPRFKELVGE